MRLFFQFVINSQNRLGFNESWKWAMEEEVKIGKTFKRCAISDIKQEI